MKKKRRNCCEFLCEEVQREWVLMGDKIIEDIEKITVTIQHNRE